VVLLTGCGFHLKGEANLALSLKQLALIKSGDKVFDDELMRQLKSAGVKLIEGDNITTLSVRLNVPAEINIAESSATSLSIQQLQVSVDYSLKMASGQWYIQNQTLSQNKEFELDSNQLLSKNKEKQQLYQQMKKNLVTILLYQLKRVQ